MKGARIFTLFLFESGFTGFTEFSGFFVRFKIYGFLWIFMVFERKNFINLIKSII